LEGDYSCLKLLNTHAIPIEGYLRNTLGSITYLLKLGGVFHNLIRTLNLKPYKKINALLGVFSKHHGLNYFGLDYQRGINYVSEYSMHMQYPL
jgi:hypothetical protein